MTKKVLTATLFLLSLKLACPAAEEYRVAGIHYSAASNSVELAYANDTNFVYGVEVCTNLTEGSWYRPGDMGMVYTDDPTNTVAVSADNTPGFCCRMQRMEVGQSAPQVTTQTSWLLRTESAMSVDDITQDAVPGDLVSIYNGMSYDIAEFIEVTIWDPFNPGTTNRWNIDLPIAAGQQFAYTRSGGGDGYIPWPYAHAGDWQLIHPSGSAPRTMTVRIEWNALHHCGSVVNPAPDYCAVVTVTGPHDYVKRFESVYNDGHVNWNSLEEPDELDSFAWDWDEHRKPDDGYYTINVEIKDAPTLSTGLDGPTIGTIEKQVYLYNW